MTHHYFTLQPQSNESHGLRVWDLANFRLNLCLFPLLDILLINISKINCTRGHTPYVHQEASFSLLFSCSLQGCGDCILCHQASYLLAAAKSVYGRLRPCGLSVYSMNRVQSPVCCCRSHQTFNLKSILEIQIAVS